MPQTLTINHANKNNTENTNFSLWLCLFAISTAKNLSSTIIKADMFQIFFI
jgi:hypothetical protein